MAAWRHIAIALVLVVFGNFAVQCADCALAGPSAQRPPVAKGDIVIETSRRVLSFGIGGGEVVEYPVAVGRPERSWVGERFIESKRIRPAWRPTELILKDKPGITRLIPGGSPRNPMGAAALILSAPGDFAIHGTNRPELICQGVSYGCFRMRNSDILDLYRRVKVGTRVLVIP